MQEAIDLTAAGDKLLIEKKQEPTTTSYGFQMLD